jgi:hypothetical protein
MIETVFTLVGIGLFITKHPGWGVLCFAIALVMLVL